MKRILLLSAALTLPLALSGCQTASGGAFSDNCKIGGTVIGAGLGALIGSQMGGGSGRALAMLAGAAAGGFLGHEIGGLLDCEDQKAAAAASQQAAQADVGDKVYWSSQGAQAQVAEAQKQAVPVAEPAPEPAAKPVAAKPAVAKPKAKPAAKVETAKAPAPAPVPASAPAKTASWQVKEPVASKGSSGMWGWSEPVSATTRTADGRTCRQLKQVVVDKDGKQSSEVVTSCLDQENRWVVATR